MREAFTKWLNNYWNDLYEVWSEADCNQYIVRCGTYACPQSDVDKFITLLNRLYGCQVQDCPWGTVSNELMKGNKFLIFLDGKTVEIRPFDDEVYNIDLIKEDD